jgi:hypothetical protein
VPANRGDAAMREANAIDFWRGFALVTIFINHIPGNYYSRFTHGNISVSDSADLFVFLAGWSMRYATGRPGRLVPTGQMLSRLCGRAFTLYAAQILITMLAIAMLAASAIIYNNPLLLEWHNAAAVFYDPVPTHIGLALITHQLGYFDILPLYVVMLLIAPAIVLIDRYLPKLLLPLSLAVYACALGFRINPATWPVQGTWFFNPLAWQLVFVLGFVLAKEEGLGELVRLNIHWLRWVCGAIVIVMMVLTVNHWWHDPTKMPSPKLFFIFDKTYVTPIRLIQFLSLVAAFSFAFPYIRRFAAPLTDFLSMLGRNSLYVFCVGSLLSLAGQIVRYVYRGSIAVDTLVVVLGIAVMALTAWLAEWPGRSRASVSARPRVSS